MAFLLEKKVQGKGVWFGFSPSSLPPKNPKSKEEVKKRKKKRLGAGPERRTRLTLRAGMLINDDGDDSA